MTGSVAIDVALGLSFIFLLYSLLATIVQEMISRWLGLRPRMLLKAMARMLDDADDREGFRFLNYFSEIGGNAQRFFHNGYRARPLTEEFYRHPTIKYLGENAWSSKPSYLNPSTFSQVVVDILRGPTYDGSQDQMELIRNTLSDKSYLNFKRDNDTLRQFRILSYEAKGDVVKFKALLEQWYNETMERCSGWFKKQTQLFLFFIGMGIAVSANVDTIALVRLLSTNETALQQLVDLASATYKDHEPDTINDNTPKKALDKSFKETAKAITQANATLGLGWNECKLRCTLQPSNWIRFLGWIITAFAISLGAPFWFDLLNKIMMLRAARKPEEKTETSSSQTNPKDRIG